MRLLKRKKKEAFWIVPHLESLILRTYEHKGLPECDSCVRILEMSTEAMHGSILRNRNEILPRSVQILFMIGTVVLVNAHSSNHEPNQEADRNPKRLLECDHSFVNRPQKSKMIMLSFPDISLFYDFFFFEREIDLGVNLCFLF